MASQDEYMILRPENAGVYGLLMFVVGGVSLSDLDIVDTNIPGEAQEQPGLSDRLLITLVIVYMKLSSAVSGVWQTVVSGMEYALNFLSFNNGLLGLIWNSITGAIVTPQPTDAAYQSMRSFQTGRAALDKKTATLIKYVPLDELEDGFQNTEVHQLAAMASNLVYENEARIQEIVNNKWKMKFEKYFACWNAFIHANATHAFIFCDKPVDAGLIVVAFRGTVGLDDWHADLDFSQINTKAMGWVHEGFMKALGLQDEKNFAAGFPPEYKQADKPLAFYAITDAVRELTGKHGKARVLVTGHSLGGALAIQYSALLALLRPEVFEKVEQVMTFGQPRVGDDAFGKFMNKKLGERYRRMVYRFDIVPRIPLNIPLGKHYKHFGTCIDYDGWFTGKRVEEMPDKNFFNPLYWPMMYWEAIEDFFLAIWIGIRRGEWEGWIAIFSRFIWIIFPGVAFHNTRNYINASRMATVTYKVQT